MNVEDRKDLPKLKVNDKVKIHDGKTWAIEGTVIEILQNPRAYQVLTNKSTKLVRNRRQLLLYKSKADVNDTHVDYDNESILSDMEDLNTTDLHEEVHENVVDETVPPVVTPVQSNTTWSGRIVTRPARYDT